MGASPISKKEMVKAHQVPPVLKSLPFIELAMFIHYRLGRVSLSELEPEMISTWIQEHTIWAEENKHAKLAYTTVAKPKRNPNDWPTIQDMWDGNED